MNGTGSSAAESAGWKPFEPRIYRGNLANYRTLKSRGKGAYGFTFEATVESLNTTAEERPQFEIKEGMHVIVKVPQIDPRRAPYENRQRLSEIYGSFLADYEALEQLTEVESVAHIIDQGTFELVLGPRSKYPIAPFFVQELVEGERLDRYVNRLAPSGKRFRGLRNANDFFGWAKKLALVIQEIHQRGVVHGDIWHENIIVDSGTDAPILIDFGQALLRDLSVPPRRTQAHPYVAPEGSGQISADIYSLGGVLYFLATGVTPTQ